MVSISIQNLTKRFGTATVLKDVSLEIEAGELFFLLGPSGCGKTTRLRHIAGFYQPDAGRILFDGQDVTHVPPHRRNTGMVFQSYALWPHLNVAQNVAFGLEERNRPQPEIEKRVADALEMVKLGGLGARKIQQLSGGQQQRVALARALVIRPKCLLLDEPLSNLDAKLRIEMRAEIRRLCKESGLTGIYVTHDREEALSMGDRIAIMEAGKLIQVGDPMEVYRDPVNRMTAEFMGETNFIEGNVGRETSREGLYDVDTPYGQLRARPNQADFKPVQGQPVLLSLRPEAITFGELADTPNRLIAKIIRATYLGAMMQYELEGKDGTTLRIIELNPAAVYPPSEDEVEVMAATNDIVMMRR